MNTRCEWAKRELMTQNRVEEWSMSARDDRRLFECLSMEGASVGSNWEPIVQKRDAYRIGLAGLDAQARANLDGKQIWRLLADLSIVRNRFGLMGAIDRGRAFLAVQLAFSMGDSRLLL